MVLLEKLLQVHDALKVVLSLLLDTLLHEQLLVLGQAGDKRIWVVGRDTGWSRAWLMVGDVSLAGKECGEGRWGCRCCSICRTRLCGGCGCGCGCGGGCGGVLSGLRGGCACMQFG